MEENIQPAWTESFLSGAYTVSLTSGDASCNASRMSTFFDNSRFVKTDTIFYRLFQTFPNIFFELLNQPQDEANAYQFSSVEVKQLAFRIDGVFMPTDAPHLPIYFAEV